MLVVQLQLATDQGFSFMMNSSPIARALVAGRPDAMQGTKLVYVGVALDLTLALALAETLFLLSPWLSTS